MGSVGGLITLYLRPRGPSWYPSVLAAMAIPTPEMKGRDAANDLDTNARRPSTDDDSGDINSPVTRLMLINNTAKKTVDLKMHR